MIYTQCQPALINQLHTTYLCYNIQIPPLQSLKYAVPLIGTIHLNLLLCKHYFLTQVVFWVKYGLPLPLLSP